MSAGGEGPFLWLGPYSPPAGFRHVPPGAMCLSVFLFVRRGSELLVGRYKEHPAWEAMTGMDSARVREGTKGWTVPARQLMLGEDPRDAARQIGQEVVGVAGMRYGEPRVEVDWWVLGEEADGPPERQKMRHFDVWFFVEAEVPRAGALQTPEWYDQLSWVEPASVPPGAWARMHGDVVERWLNPTARR